MPSTSFPVRGPEVYISYAWHDETPEGQRRGALVDSMCCALGVNVKIHRDKVDLENGDRISEFMNRLIGGDLIVTVLSDKYLRSPACMYELFGIYRRCGDQPQRFLRSVFRGSPGREDFAAGGSAKYAKFWKEQRDELDAALRDLGDIAYAGVETPKQYRMVDEFARNVADC